MHNHSAINAFFKSPDYSLQLYITQMWDTKTNYNVIALYLLDIECDCKVSVSQKDVRVLTP